MKNISAIYNQLLAQGYGLKLFGSGKKEGRDKELRYLVDRGYSEEEVKEMGLGAYVARDELKKHLLAAGYSEEQARRKHEAEGREILKEIDRKLGLH